MVRSLRFVAPLLALGLVVAVSQVLRAQDAPSQNTASINGTVTDQDQKPVANATVTLRQKAEEPADQAMPEAKKPHAKKARAKYTTVGTTKTDKDGKFTFSNVKAGDYLVSASDKTAGTGAKMVKVTGSQSQDVSISLKPRPTKKPAAQG